MKSSVLELADRPSSLCLRGEGLSELSRLRDPTACPSWIRNLFVGCQPALNIDPRSASKIDPPVWWLVPVVHRGDPRDAECPSRG